MNRTLIIFKPDTFRRGLVGEILSRFEGRGLVIVDVKVKRAGLRLLGDHYAEHKGKAYFTALIEMMSAGPLIACVLQGNDDVVPLVRRLLGDYRDPAPGTIRGDYQTTPMYNLVHASDSESAAMREIKLWFPPDEPPTEEASPNHGEEA